MSNIQTIFGTTRRSEILLIVDSFVCSTETFLVILNVAMRCHVSLNWKLNYRMITHDNVGSLLNENLILLLRNELSVLELNYVIWFNTGQLHLDIHHQCVSMNFMNFQSDKSWRYAKIKNCTLNSLANPLRFCRDFHVYCWMLVTEERNNRMSNFKIQKRGWKKIQLNLWNWLFCKSLFLPHAYCEFDSEQTKWDTRKRNDIQKILYVENFI